MSSLEQEDTPEPAPRLTTVLAGELVLRVHEYLTQIQALLQHPPSPADHAAAPLVQGALGCISKLTSMMVEPDKAAEGPAPPAAAADASPSSDQEQPSKKRKIQAPRRNSYRRRCEESRIKTSKTIDDGYSWRKYGQKEIYGSKFSRNYYRCSHKYDRNCQATRQVQRSEEDPSLYVITYLGEHACTNPDLTCCRSPSSQEAASTCIIDFTSAATVAAPPPPSSSLQATLPKPEWEEDVISRGSFAAGSSSTPELPAAFPEYLWRPQQQLPEAMAGTMEEYFAGMASEECDVTSGWHYVDSSGWNFDVDALAFDF